MTPQRVIRPARRHWRTLIAGVVFGLVILGALAFAAWAVVGRANDLNEALYQQCVRDELQDAVITAGNEEVIAQLRAAKRRLVALPEGSAERVYQAQVLTLGIATLEEGVRALEPVDEQPCQPPEGVGP